MRKIRKQCFETNSSSTHSLSIARGEKANYIPLEDTLVIDFMDMDDEQVLSTLKEKVSYLVSQIVDNYKWKVSDYEELKKQVERSFDFQKIADYVKLKYKKKIVLPEKYKLNKFIDEDGVEYNDLEEITNINHMVKCSDLDELLSELVSRQNLLEEVLREDINIVFDHD